MQEQAQKKSLLLASSSPYRKMLLERLGLPFDVRVPDIAEVAHPGESPARMVARLAAEKAEAVANRHTGALVIGSD